MIEVRLGPSKAAWTKLASRESSPSHRLGHVEPNAQYERFSTQDVHWHNANPHEWATRNLNGPSRYQVPAKYRGFFYTLTEDEFKSSARETNPSTGKPFFTEYEIRQILYYEPPSALESAILYTVVGGILAFIVLPTGVIRRLIP
jgi:hypothetical protein